MKKNELKKLRQEHPIMFSKVNVPGYGLGYVVGYYHGFYAVDFDDFVEGGTTCGGLCTKWHGQWIPEEEIEYGIALRFVQG